MQDRFAAQGRLSRFAIVIAVGALVACSVVGAALWRQDAQRENRRAFEQEAAGITSSIGVSLRRIDDLMVTLRTKIATTRDLSNQDLASWFRVLDQGDRYPGVLGFLYVQYTRPDELAAFKRTIDADPVRGIGNAGAPFTLRDTGSSFYCPLRYTLALDPIAREGLPSPNVDLCSRPGTRRLLLSARDGGQFRSLGFEGVLPGSVVLATPVYAGGLIPPRTQRRRALMGWVTATFDVRMMLMASLRGHPNVAIRLTREDIATTPAQRAELARDFRLGRVRNWIAVGPDTDGANTSVATVAADGLWHIETSTAKVGGLSPDIQGLLVLLAGLAASAAVLVMMRSRSFALKLVEARTHELRHLALHDPLTGLPNRAAVNAHADQALQRARDSGSISAAMFLDLDNFKEINDTYGHATGDELLRLVAERIRSVLREDDTVGRIGGDEFVIVIGGEQTTRALESLARRIIEALREPFLVDPEIEPLLITASIGVAAGDRPNAIELLRDADIALYEAKAAGRNTFVVFQPDMHASLSNRRETERELRKALDDDQLVIEYQPVVNLSSERIRGAEALLRWRHPRRGLLGPMEFVGIAEDTGLIVDIGRWVIATACEQAVAWHRAGFPVRVSVNVSSRQLAEPDFVSMVRLALDNSGLDADSLVLEITESTAMRDPEQIRDLLCELQRIGVQIAIDDFGTGYSSLAYLRDFPVNVVKIDRSFTADIGRSPAARALIRAIVQLGRSLDLVVLAEGIETERQVQLLREESCDAGQGYLFARPQDVEGMTALLRADSARGPWAARTGKRIKRG